MLRSALLGVALTVLDLSALDMLPRKSGRVLALRPGDHPGQLLSTFLPSQRTRAIHALSRAHHFSDGCSMPIATFDWSTELRSLAEGVTALVSWTFPIPIRIFLRQLFSLGDRNQVRCVFSF